MPHYSTRSLRKEAAGEKRPRPFSDAAGDTGRARWCGRGDSPRWYGESPRGRSAPMAGSCACLFHNRNTSAAWCCWPARSLTLPAGLRCSNFAKISMFGNRRLNLSRGVLPISTSALRTTALHVPPLRPSIISGRHRARNKMPGDCLPFSQPSQSHLPHPALPSMDLLSLYQRIHGKGRKGAHRICPKRKKSPPHLL